MLYEQLTFKQQRFVKAYLCNGGNALQAALTAGYSKRSAPQISVENMQKPLIKDYLLQQRKLMERKAGLTPEYLYGKLKDCIELSITEEEGKKELKNHNALLGAISEVNKMQGNYAKEKTEVTVEVSNKTDELIDKYKKDY
jgi:phage terminase small subunit